jgi:Tfp pilus assembly protein PilF
LLQQAIAHHQAGRLQQAEHICEQIIEVDSENANAYNLLGVIAHQEGKNDIAFQLISKSIAKDSNQPSFYNNLGSVLGEQGKLDDAIQSYQRALSINPDYAEAHYNLGVVLGEQGKLDDAIQSYQRALSINPDYAEAHNNLGSVLRKQDKLDDAMQSYQRALSVNPDYADAHSNLGDVLQEQGKLDDAIQSYRRVLSINPDYAKAHRNLAKLKRHTNYDYEIQKMEVLHRKLDITAEQRMHLAFGLGKAFEDLGEHEKSFKFILEGNELKRNTYTYNIIEDMDFFNNLKNVFNGQLFRKHADDGHGDNTPIFIVGMMRSGSTLVEQILASHTLVCGAGELSDLSKIAIRSSEKITGTKFPFCVAKLSPQNLENLGADYTKRLRQFSGSAKYITDKMLNNFLFIGMIRLILPNAKIIHCKRDPKDICLSVFKNYFAADTHKYAYDLRELGEYYNLYQELMDYWYNILPGYILGIQYEDIVGNHEDTTRKLLEYCELPWDEACLSFHRTVRPVRTASVEQVRRPIYNSSVGLWRQYEKHLSPLLHALGCAGL